MPRGFYERKPRPAVERFWEKVDKSGDCWEWRAGKYPIGYGHFWFNGKDWSAHRFSWLLHNGKIPEGMNVCHHCDNKLCVNPKHLFLGTQKDNIQDALKKGRLTGPRGEACANSKLTAEKVLEICEEYRVGNITQRELAEKHNVGQPAIHRIVTRKRWKHLLPSAPEDKEKR